MWLKMNAICFKAKHWRIFTSENMHRCSPSRRKSSSSPGALLACSAPTYNTLNALNIYVENHRCKEAMVCVSFATQRSFIRWKASSYDNIYVESNRHLFYKEAMVCVSFETLFGRLTGDVQGPPGSVRRDERCSEGRMDIGRNARLQGKLCY